MFMEEYKSKQNSSPSRQINSSSTRSSSISRNKSIAGVATLSGRSSSRSSIVSDNNRKSSIASNTSIRSPSTISSKKSKLSEFDIKNSNIDDIETTESQQSPYNNTTKLPSTKTETTSYKPPLTNIESTSYKSPLLNIETTSYKLPSTNTETTSYKSPLTNIETTSPSIKREIGYDLSSVSSLLATSPQLSAILNKKFEKNSTVRESLLKSSPLIKKNDRNVLNNKELNFTSVGLEQNNLSVTSESEILTLSSSISLTKISPVRVTAEEKNISPNENLSNSSITSPTPSSPVKVFSDTPTPSSLLLNSSSKVYPDTIDTISKTSKSSSTSSKVYPLPQNNTIEVELTEPIIIKANRGPDFQTYGVSIRLLRNLLKAIKGKKIKVSDDLSMTRDVVENFISEITKHDECSMCEYLLNYWTTVPHPIFQNQRNDIKMVANLFICHAWMCSFEHLVEAIETFISLNPRDDGKEWSIWIDIFSFNQHVSLHDGPTSANIEWYRNTLTSLLTTIGHTLIIYLPWDNPVVLKRTWCLWEIYCSHINNVKISIQLSKKRHPAFLKLICEKFETALDVFNNSSLNVDNSQSASSKCRGEIFEAMRMFCDDGSHGVNVAIKQSIRNWVVNTAIKVLTTEIEHCQNSKLHAKMMSGKAIGPVDLILHLFGCRAHKDHGEAYRQFLLQEFRLANYLGTLYTEKEYLTAAEKYFNHAILVGRKFLKKNHTAILAITSNLALICKKRKDYEKAEELYNFCLKEKNQELGSSHPSTLVTAFNLAVCIKERGDAETALAMMIACLTDQEVELGLEHPDTMHTLENVASILLEMKRNAEAHRLLQKSVDYRIKRYGPSHHETVTILETVAELYAHENDMDDAINVYQRVLETKRSSLGHAHPSTLMTCERLAAIYRVEEEFEKSLKLFEFVYESHKVAFGETHRISLDSLSKVAEVYNKLENYKKAEELLRQVVQLSKLHLGSDDDITLSSEYHLANILIISENYDEALDLHKRGFDTRSRLLGSKHVNTLLSSYGYSVTLVYKKKFVDAYPLLETCLKNFDEVVGPENDYSLKVAESFATVCKVIGDFRTCDKLYNRLVQTYMKLHGSNHPLSVQAVRNLQTILQGPKRI